MRRTLAPLLTLLLLAAVPSGAQAAVRYAAPDGSTTSNRCDASAPCRIDRAVNGAAHGDEVIVAPGTYKLTTPLKPYRGIALHGDRGHDWPRIVGGSSLKGSVLTFTGGTLSHLSLESTASDRAALTLTGGVADGIRLLSAAGDGGALVASAAGTVLRNSVVRTTDASGGAAGLRLGDHSGGDAVVLRNVTVMAVAGSAVGILCEVKDGSASVVNAIVRGRGADIVGRRQCTAAFSSFRPAFSWGLTAGAGNQSAEPVFADADYRPAAGSPTIDAGTADAFAAGTDPDGRARALGAAPDIGAYEYPPPATPDPGAPAPQAPDPLRAVPPPKQGVSVVVGAARGTIRVRVPGAARFTTLARAARIPVGSVVDARRGRVRLMSALGGGRTQTGLFWGSKFKTTQRRKGDGMTTLTLQGGNFAACRARSALAVASGKRKRKPRRSLWGRDSGGRFRTHGNDSVASARGTAWLTRDTCRGTLTRVTEGAVLVRDLVRRKRVLLGAGDSYLARARR